MNFQTHFHQHAKSRIPASILKDVESALASVPSPSSTITSKELVASIRTALTRFGWSEEVLLDRTSKITISGMKGDIGLAIQFGNISRIYADLIKLQSLFLDAKSRGAVVIVPSKSLLHLLSRSGGTDNRCHLERILRELPIFSLVITMPIAFYAMAPD